MKERERERERERGGGEYKPNLTGKPGGSLRFTNCLNL